MKTNITFCRGNVAASALPARRANSFKPKRRIESGRDATPAQVPAPAILMMVWRTNPASGRLECRWVTECGTATDEGVSCNDLLRQAA
jgi:hypothetical protein